MQHISRLVTCIVAASGLLLLSACSKQEYAPFSTPFFHINVDNKDSITVSYNRKDEVEYKVYLSAELQYTPVELQYELVVGDGLLEGRDFVLKNTTKTLSFAPGMFDRGIRIGWLERTLDPQKNNTLILKLAGNSKGYTLGLPGPGKKQQQLVITKTN